MTSTDDGLRGSGYWHERAEEVRSKAEEMRSGDAQYRAALGEQALENLIRGRVRDMEWSPGSLHRRLLQLPWADVLTTNWDTLLERAAASDPDTSYDVVRVPSDIARARQPRIVKLHGSMPSHAPFIFSEEDFRTYPQRFAPFVNLAQRARLQRQCAANRSASSRGPAYR